MGKREDTYGIAEFFFKVIIGIAFFVFIALAKGLAALMRGEMDEAVRYLTLPCLVAGLIGYLYLQDMNAKAAEQRAYAEQARQHALLTNLDAELVKADPDGLVTIRRLRSLSCGSEVIKILCSTKTEQFGEYEIASHTNTSYIHISTYAKHHNNLHGGKVCNVDIYVLDRQLSPGETLKFYCLERQNHWTWDGWRKIVPCIVVQTEIAGTEYRREFCQE